MAIVEAEAEVIREIAVRLLGDPSAGIPPETIKSILRDLVERDVWTARGKQFSNMTFRRLMLNPRIAGLQQDEETGELVEAPGPAILTRETYDRVVALLNDPARRAGGDRAVAPGKRRVYLLSGGLVLCGLCGSPLQAAPSNRGRRGYACKPPGCNKIRIAAEPLEQDVAERVLARLASPVVWQRLRDTVDDAADGSLKQRIDQAEEKLEELAQSWADDDVDSVSYRAARERLSERVKGWKTALERSSTLLDLPGGGGNPRALAEWWTDPLTPVTLRRDLVGVILDHALIGTATRPGFTGFDEGRVTYVWR